MSVFHSMVIGEKPPSKRSRKQNTTYVVSLTFCGHKDMSVLKFCVLFSQEILVFVTRLLETVYAKSLNESCRPVTAVSSRPTVLPTNGHHRLSAIRSCRERTVQSLF